MKTKLINKYLIILISAFFFFSCGEKKQGQKAESSLESDKSILSVELNPEEYLKWYENPENGFLLEKNMNEFSFVTLYKPINYLALIELQKLDSINEKEFEKVKKTYEGMDYFTFKISTKATNDELIRYKLKPGEDYYDRLDYLSFKAQKDFYLTNNSDTINCTLFHFERSFGLAPVLTFVLGFEKMDKTISDDMTFVFEDRMFGNGTLKFLFDKDRIRKQPTLNIRKN